MTIKEIIDKAIYIQFPKTSITYNNYNINDIHKLPLPNNMMYSNWKLNTNHFTTEYHRLYVLPLLNELLHINYDESQFHLVKIYYNENDISMLYPNEEYLFDIYSFEHDELIKNITFNDFVNVSECYDLTSTAYHKLYKYPHECSKIINNTINSNRKLLISGDSQMIPDVPILACYFKEILYLDNRSNKSFKKQIEEFEPTDVLIALNAAGYHKYSSENFR